MELSRVSMADGGEKLHRTELFQLMMEHSPTPMLLYCNEELVMANSAWEKLTGIKQHEATTLEALCHRVFPGNKAVLANIRRNRKSRVTTRNEHHELTTVNGEKIYVSTSAVSVESQMGVQLRIVTFTDITQEELLKQKLTRKKIKLEMSLAVSKTGIYSWDLQTGSVRADTQTKHIFDIHPDEPMTFESFIEAIFPEDRAKVEGLCAKVMETGESFDHVYRVRTGDGSIRWIADKATCLLNSLNKPIMLVGAVLDVSKIRCENATEQGGEFRLQDKEALYMLEEVHVKLEHLKKNFESRLQ